MKNRLDWNRYVPPGMDGGQVRNWLSWLLVVGGAGSLQFLSRYTVARNQLFQPGVRRTLRPNARITPFEDVLRGSFVPMAAVVPVILAVAVYLYLYHFRTSRSIYTMKRLPNRWELPRRCLTLPVGALLTAAVLTAALTGVYYLIWRFGTPAACLP